MITTFEIILTDCMELKSIPWRCVIIDEAHRLKNRNCKLLEGLRMLNTEHRVLLTGTPLQNNVEELFSLLNFLEPNRFASTEAFLEEFGNLKTESQVDKLKALLKPMMLRRLKEDVEKSLAPKEETVVEVELTNIQKKYYRAILERNFTFLTKGNCYSNIPNLMNTMMELRKCCIHPFLINGAEEQINSDYRMQHEESLESNLNAMIQASGKLVLMDKLLPRLRTDGHRVLVFSQMVRCLDILEDYLVQKRYPYERIDGRVRGNLRQAAIDRFCKPDSDRFVFLLCTRAGGLGINLTAADTVIIFDSDWNPQNDLQAQARCHRIGQSKAVKVYRLICRNTYEREMFDKASLKLGLDKAVLQSMAVKDNVGMNQQMSKKEVEDLLRKGAYGALMDDDNAGDKFCEEDIDQILQRRTQVITLESGTKGSTFSKATFASASTRSDIEIDDPNFWEKWAKKAQLDVDELKNRNELIIQEPRRRTQTRRFGTDDLIDLSDLESSDEDDENVSARTRASRKGGSSKKLKGRGRDRDDDFMDDLPPGNWTRADHYKMEKGLLTFGWGRWDECIALGQFRRRLTHKDCEEISRTILLYCLLHYKGDEKIKSFIWDLICPNYEGEERIHKNHSESETTIEQDLIFDGYSADGLSAPVPRGRKGKKIKKETKNVDQVIEECEWTKEEVSNPDSLLNDEIYKRHLNRHSNKVLLRVRLLYYLRHEIIGDLHDQVFSGRNASEIPLFVPPSDGEPPAPWWDIELDKSLLLGIYKHGFERYNLMRQDPLLCFLSRCGPPDGAALLAELNVGINNEDEMEESTNQKDEMEPMSPSSDAMDTPKNTSTPNSYMYNMLEMGPILFPSVTDVNTRVRRLVTAFQRNNKKLEIRNAQKARKMERREKFEAAIRERELKKRDLQQRKWSRREEADFYRTISSFGVEYDEAKKEFSWVRFRGIARLERKYDETLAEYYRCFYAMCKRVCGRQLSLEEEQLSLNVEPISEERASRCLQRVELLNKIREEILGHPELDERLKLCQSSMDLPDWWICGKHDKDLLFGAAKHGLSRMDYHLLHDPTLSFKDVLKNYPNAKSIQIGNMMHTPIGCSSPLNIYQTDDSLLIKEEGLRKLKEELPIPSEEATVKEEPVPYKPDVDYELEHDKEVEPNKDETEKSTFEEKETEVKEKEEVSINDKDEPEIKETVVEVSKALPEGDSIEENTELPVLVKVDTSNESIEEKMEVDSEIPESASETKEKSVLNVTANSEISMEDDFAIDTSSELKIDEDAKVEDEETDIEMDSKKDDDVKEEAMPVLETQKIKSPPAVEDTKYNCDTDMELKSMTRDESPLAKLEQAVVKAETPVKVKKEEVEDISREKYNTRRLFAKEDPLVDDSQGCMSQNDDVMSQASFNLETDMGEPTVAQLLAFTNGNAVRWPKDKVLQIRLEHVVHAVEKNEWPIIRHTFLPYPPSASTPHAATPTVGASPSPAPSLSSQGGQRSEQATPEPPLQASSLPDPLPLPDFHSPARRSPLQQPPPPHIPPPTVPETSKHRRRRRRRRFEIEAERAKLRQLLSHNMQQQQQHHHQQQLQHVQQFLASSSSSLRSKLWGDDALPPPPEDTLKIPSPAPQTSAAAPPPAHQNSSPRLPPSLPPSLDLRLKPPTTAPPFAPQKPGPPPSPPLANVSPGSPMDLSASSAPPAHASSQATTKSPHSTKTKEKRGSRGGSRIDALALNLQARKQQQMMQQEQHDPPRGDHEPLPRSTSHRATLEEEEAKLRKKRLQYSEESVRKALNRGFDMTPAPAHSSFFSPAAALGSSSSGGSGRHGLGGLKGDESALDSLVHHDFKKWIEEHPELVAANPNLVAAAAAAMATFSPPASNPFPSHTEVLELPEGRRRGRRPRLDPSKLDYDKVTGEENVSVVNRLTGKKITGSKAPPLKYLAEWLDKNPMFDVDPKWGPLVREKLGLNNRGNLPNNMSKRIVAPSEKRGRRTAASLLASAHQNLVPPVTTMSFPSSTGLNPLSFANTGMLGGFPSMKFFMDPPKSSTSTTPTTVATSTTSPLFLPFGGLAGLGGLTNPLFGFPGFGFPPGGPLSTPGKEPKEEGKSGKESSSRAPKAPSSSSLPFLYPPGLLYNPLGLGGFTLPPNLPASFPSSFTQSGLVNGLGLPLFTSSGLGVSSTATVTSPAMPPTVPTVSSKRSDRERSSVPLMSPKLPSVVPPQSHDGQTETDDESLKSLMGNHEDDTDDNLDDGQKTDASDREGVIAPPVVPRPKTPVSDAEGVTCLAKTNTSDNAEVKSRRTFDDPTSDSTDTESKHS